MALTTTYCLLNSGRTIAPSTGRCGGCLPDLITPRIILYTCYYEDYYGHGHALNVFIRRSHGAGPYRDDDVYFEHAIECGVAGNLEDGIHSGNATPYWYNSKTPLGYDMRWQTCSSTSLIRTSSQVLVIPIANTKWRF